MIMHVSTQNQMCADAIGFFPLVLKHILIKKSFLNVPQGHKDNDLSLSSGTRLDRFSLVLKKTYFLATKAKKS